MCAASPASASRPSPCLAGELPVTMTSARILGLDGEVYAGQDDRSWCPRRLARSADLRVMACTGPGGENRWPFLARTRWPLTLLVARGFVAAPDDVDHLEVDRREA